MTSPTVAVSAEVSATLAAVGKPFTSSALRPTVGRGERGSVTDP